MKTNPNYVKETYLGNHDPEAKEPFTAREREIIEAKRRTAQIAEFLAGEFPYNYNNMVNDLFPDSMEENCFIWQSTPECRNRFYYWITSGPGLIALWKFEKNLLNSENNVKDYYCKKAFFIDYLNRLKLIYKRLDNDEVIRISNKNDFLALYLFFSQIDRFVINDIGQTEPMKLEDLKHLILDWFYTNMNEVTEISGFEDIGKLVIIEIVPYRYYGNEGSIIPNMTGDRHHYNFEFLEGLDCVKIHENFNTMEESEDFDNLLSEFTANNWTSDYFIRSEKDFPF